MTPNEIKLELLEERLKILTIRVNDLTSDTEAFVKHVDTLFNSDGKYPGLYGRIIALEDFRSSVRWAIGVIYTAFIGLLVKLMWSNV